LRRCAAKRELQRTAATSIAAAQKRKRANVGTPHNALKVSCGRREKTNTFPGLDRLAPTVCCTAPLYHERGAEKPCEQLL